MTHIFLLSTLCLRFLLLSVNGPFILVQGRSGNLPCNLTSITADEPSFKYTFEAGVSEFWNRFSNQFICAGVDAVRNTILHRGLVLPYYIDDPQLIYILKGEGVQGTVFPGCPNDYESDMDQYQRVRKFKEGDILALPAGVTLWFYNTGDVPVVTLSISKFRSPADQLDPRSRMFYLAGNNSEGGFGNIFSSFGETSLAESFNVTVDLALQLQGESDIRGQIVLAPDLMIEMANVIIQEEQPKDNQGSRCTMKLGVNLIEEDPDLHNPSAGRITSVNSQKLPHLDLMQLSASRVVLHKNAMLAPHWNVNADSIMYIISGSINIQVDDRTGNLLNGEVGEGQTMIMPGDLLALSRAGMQGCELLAFMTNGNPETSTLAGPMSAIQAMPMGVLMSSYNISREDASRLKYNRQETMLFSPVMI